MAFSFVPADLITRTAPNISENACGLATAEPPRNRAGCARSGAASTGPRRAGTPYADLARRARALSVDFADAHICGGTKASPHTLVRSFVVLYPLHFCTVQELAAEYFGMKTSASLNGDEAAAFGSTLYAAGGNYRDASTAFLPVDAPCNAPATPSPPHRTRPRHATATSQRATPPIAMQQPLAATAQPDVTSTAMQQR